MPTCSSRAILKHVCLAVLCSIPALPLEVPTGDFLRAQILDADRREI